MTRIRIIVRASRCKNRGFTLLETLTVITVLILLAIIIFSVSKKMRDVAQNAACVSNLRTVAQALLIYSTDHDGTLPPFYSDANNPAETHWQYVIGTQYLNEPASSFGSGGDASHSVLRCPADHTFSRLSGHPRRVRSIAINGSAYPGYDYGYPPWPLPRGVTNRKLSSIKHPAQLCMIADGGSGEFTNEWGYSARLSSIGTPTAPLKWFTRHSKGGKLGMNCAMVDGHVEWRSAEWLQNERERDHNHGDSIFFDSKANF